MRQARATAFLSLTLLNVFAIVAASSVAVLIPSGVVTRPETSELPDAVAGRVPLRPLGGAPGGPSPSRVAAALAGPMQSSNLNGSLAMQVVDATTGKPLFRSRGNIMSTPASTTKLFTAAAVLAAAGPGARLATRVVRGTQPGSVILVGGGDPTLRGPAADAGKGEYPHFARLTKLAEATADRLKKSGRRSVTLGYDTSLLSGPRTAPTWSPGDVATGYVAPITALSINEAKVQPGGRARVSSPPAVAARTFADLLRGHGITVRENIERQRAPQEARTLAKVTSPPMSTLVAYMLGHSNNYVAELLARQVALHTGKPATFEGASAAIEQVMVGLGVTEGVQLYDGSGLSFTNKISPAALTELLTLAASPRHPQLRPVLTGMPVANFFGSLQNRFGGLATGAGQGVVRAKTGTLTGVSGLAGVVRTKSGHLLAFAFLANNVSAWRAEPVLDRLAAALASCGCVARASQSRTGPET